MSFLARSDQIRMDFMSYAFEGSSGLELAAAAESLTGGSGRLVVNERMNLKSLFSPHHQIHDDESPNHEGAEFMEFGLPQPPVCVDPSLRPVSSSDKDLAEMMLSSSSHPPPVTVFGRIPAPDMEIEEAAACNWLPRYHNFNLRSEETDNQSLFKGAPQTTNFESPHSAAIPVNKRLVDSNKVKSGQNSKEKLGDLSPSMEEAAATAETSSATVVKRARITNNLSSSNSHPPICQVHGCFKDLSSSKDYYRRHRVCNEHSKTTKVIVDGIEQRFCQQCSRFHLLSEFDDDKRSCRKSLAGHNERRRKPQFDTHHGPRFFDMTTLQTEQFFLPELLPVNYFCQELENTSSIRSTKTDEKHISFSKLGAPKKSKTHGTQKPEYYPLSSKNNNTTIQQFPTAENPSTSAHSLLSSHPEIPANILASDWDLGLCSGVLEMEGRRSGYDAVDGNMMSVYYEGEMDENSESAENGPTIDLEQLSTHLQRVEHQRNLSAQTKQMESNNLFYCFTSG
nr:squamosa promoter-binding-like protein 6 [Ipomoea batatas]